MESSGAKRYYYPYCTDDAVDRRAVARSATDAEPRRATGPGVGVARFHPLT
jgi:hypothetical protein